MFMQEIHSIGGKAYLVGGSVRDKILGITPKDIDVCVTGLTRGVFEKAFPYAKLSGLDFPVFTIGDMEVAFARTERSTGKGYKDFETFTSPDLTIEDDLKRRDFTIGSIAIDIHDKFIDPYNGIKDIKNKILRHTSKAFMEDPLRVMRLARFSARLGFDIHPDTITMAKNLAPDLLYISSERIMDEFEKGIMFDNPVVFLQILDDLNALEVILPEITKMKDVPAGPIEHHPEGSTWNHTMECLNKAVLLGADFNTRFAVLLHDVGKILTPQEELPHHYNHTDLKAEELVRNICHRFKTSNTTTKLVVKVLTEHMRVHKLDEMNPKSLTKFIKRFGRDKNKLEQFLTAVKTDDKHESDNYNMMRDLHDIVYGVSGDDIPDKLRGPQRGEHLHMMQVEAVKKYVKEKEDGL